MPIVDMTFENGIFFAKEVGTVNDKDARLWVDTLGGYAAASPVPVIVLVDAMELSAITGGARDIFVESSTIPNVAASVIAVRDLITAQVSRALSARGRRGATHLFSNLEEARRFAEQQAILAAGGDV